MAIVTGKLTDFGLALLTPYAPELVFVPSGPAVIAGALLATKPVVVIPAADGSFTVNLQPTDATQTVFWYTLTVEWLNSSGGYVGKDFPDWKLFVPTSGGTIGDLVTAPANPAMVWIGESEPPNPSVGTWWLIPSTGDLKEWSK